ncbi:signal peptidase I [Halorientalis brevis]|uniref:Signal peptidase I n=1 Tax=Halorientalis brevis TaxID=1126241 RepID=A0ABD6CA46_9EURY|nr:signal peptidase I [Halorientalis brevis]
MVREVVGATLKLCIVVFVAALLVGQILGQPVLLSFVKTESMEPTLNPGDGFIAIPSAIVGDIEKGDVVVFQAEELHDGGLTTHRVVRETKEGYITKGDGNPFTDQDNEEPPVKNAQVVAVVWQSGGRVVSIPHLGTLITSSQTVLETVQRELAAALGTRSLLGTQGLAYILLGISVVAYLLDLWLGGSEERPRERQRSRNSGTSVQLLIAVFAALIVISATAAMVIPAGQEKFGIVSAESDSPGPSVIKQGTNETVGYQVSNSGLIPVMVFFESATDGVTVEPTELKLSPQTTVNASVTLSTPPETGYYREFLVQHRYLAILPAPTIRTLYGIHPWLPILVIDGILGGGFYLGGIAVLGTGRLRSRARTDSPTRDLLD